MRVSDYGYKFIAANEGVEAASFDGKTYHAYWDGIGGCWTIGHGLTFAPDGSKVERNTVWTVEEEAKNFRRTVNSFATMVNVYAADKVKLKQHQFDALVDFAYNVGINNFRNSTLLKKLLKQDFQGAADELLRWNKSGGREIQGLTVRRERERDLFLNGA